MVPATTDSRDGTKLHAIFCDRVFQEEVEDADDLQSFDEYIETLPEFSQRLLRQVDFVPGRECLMSNRKLRSGSDGSLDQETELASFGWLILGNGNILVRGAGPVDGVPDLLSSTRAELFGIAAKIEFLYQFCRYSNIPVTKSQLVAFVDNRAAIKRVNHTRGKHSKRRRICHEVHFRPS